MNQFEPQKISLHRSWLRLLPYAMLGAFLISLKSTNSFSSLVQNYFLLLGIEVIIIALYLLANKVLKREA